MASPKSTAIAILVLSAALLLSATSVASGTVPPAPAPMKHVPIATCVKLIFDPPAEAPPKMKGILCRDLLRTIAISFRVTGKISPEYVAALKTLPRFKDDPKALEKYLCGFHPPKKFGCDHGTKI